MITNSNPTIAILSDREKYKLASIMFDYINPLDGSEDVPKELIYTINNPSGQEVETKYVRPLIDKLRSTKGFYDYHFKDEALVDEMTKLVANHVMEDFLKVVDKNKFIPIPFFNSLDKFKNFYRSKNNILSKKIEVELINAPIISVENIGWEQIIQAKKDSEFKTKVRNFSLFINKNYEGKSVDFIQDSLCRQIEDYEDILKKHGFNYYRTAMKELVNSKSLIGTLALILMSSLIATPGFAMATGVIGALVEIGNVHLKISEIEDEFSTHINNSDISLLIELGKMTKMNT